MKALFKFIFGIIGAVAITVMIFFASLAVGHAITGSWDIREWNKSNIETEYQPE